MKKILSIILSLLMISSTFTGLGSITANASEISSDEVSAKNVGGFIYEVNDYGEAVLQGYDGTDVDVIIPVEIGGYIVTEIASGAFACNDNIVSVEIPCTIREIGESAFENCENLYGVRIDNNADIHIIKQSTFANCRNLREVVLPDRLEIIENRAFLDCEYFESIVVPERVEYIAFDAFDRWHDFTIYGYAGTYAQEYAIENYIHFVTIGTREYTYEIRPDGIVITGYHGYACGGLVEIPEQIEGLDVVAIGDSAFAFNDAIVELVLPETVKTIGMNAFRNCYNLEIVRGVYGGNNVEIISDYAFSGCESLEHFERGGYLREIGKYAFDRCYNLEWLYIGENIERIGDCAFNECYSMEYIIFAGESEGYREIEISDYAFVSLLGNFYILGARDSYIHHYAVDNNINFVGFGEEIDPETGFVYRVDYNDYEGAIITGYIGTESEFSTELIIPETITGYDGYSNYEVVAIADHAFEDNLMVTSVVIPDTVLELGVGCFSDCDNLTSVTFSDGLKTIGSHAFGACDSLKSVVIPKETVIEEEAFSDYSDLIMYGYMNSPAHKYAQEMNIAFKFLDALVDEETDFQYIVDENDEIIIVGYEGVDTSIVIPATIDSCKVVAVDDYAFYECYEIESIVIADSVVEIGEYAFAYCDSLKSISLPKGIFKISEYAFCSCDNLTSIVLPESITTIERGAFSGCRSLPSINLPDGLQTLGESAFYNCDKLTSIVLPESITTIERDAFYDCDGLISVNLPDGLKVLGEYAFCNCDKLTSIVIPESIKTIQRGTFRNCTGLTEIVIPKETTMYYNAFDSVNPELVIYGYTDSPAQTFAEKNNITFVCLDAPDFTYEINENNEVTITGYTGTDTDIVIPETIERCKVVAIDEYAFSYCSSITSVEIPDSVTSIGLRAFWNCSSLKSIEIPDSITSIGGSAFNGCSSLTTIEIPDSVVSIGDSTFQGCSSLTAIEIPDLVTSIGYYMFTDCSSLTSIEMPNSVTSIGGAAFEGCSSLISIKIPDSVTTLNYNTFKECSSLISVELSDSVTSIGSGAFEGCSSLISIEIPNSVTSIGKNAFKGVGSEFVMYGYTNSPAQTYAEENRITFIAVDVVKGDMSGDGVVDINDVTDIQKLIIGEEELTAQQLYVADVDGDGIVCVRDATYIQKYLAGVIGTL